MGGTCKDALQITFDHSATIRSHGLNTHSEVRLLVSRELDQVLLLAVMPNNNMMAHRTTNNFQCNLASLPQQSIYLLVSQPPHNIKKLILGPIMLKTDGQIITRIMTKYPSSYENYRQKNGLRVSAPNGVSPTRCC